MKPINIAVYDYETGSRNPHRTQPIQLGCIIIDGRTLKPIEGAVFNKLMKAYVDEDCDKYGVDPLEDEALAKNGKSRQDIALAPDPKTVWSDFVDFIREYHTAKGAWSAPICAGWNNNDFDDHITRRLIMGNRQAENEPYGFGPADDHGREKLFHPLHNYDMAQISHTWLRSRTFPFAYLSLDNMRDYLGMSKENAHDALADCYDTAEILVRFLKLHSDIKVNFKNACSKGRLIKAS